MRRLLKIGIVLLTLIFFVGLTIALRQTETACPPGQLPRFQYGFAFLKSQLGEVMGDPLECEQYDSLGNAFQKTTTGQAFYDKETNTPMFTSGKRHWAWTATGLQQWLDSTTAPPRQLGATSVSLTPTPTTAIKVMSYNVLFGAGADPAWERAAARLTPFSYPGNRLPALLTVIKTAQPDILGIQEAAAWDKDRPSIAQQVADEVGLPHYFLATADNGLHVALFSRFEIVSAENLSPQVGNVGSLRATLLTPDQQLIHVLVVHLDPFSAATRTGEIAMLTEKMLPYLQAATILLGDMNFECLDTPAQCAEYQGLSQAGWRLGAAGPYEIDQIWTSPRLAESITALTFPTASFDFSDHLPVGATISLPR